ncbi:MAG: hypothetical protein ABMA64_24955 [Myxococcota bacterium]
MPLPAATVPSTHDDAPRGDGIVVLRGLGWADWRRSIEARGDLAGPRMAYLDGALQLMSPSRDHERIKSYLGRLVETWALEPRSPRGLDLAAQRAPRVHALRPPDEAGSEAAYEEVGASEVFPGLDLQLVLSLLDRPTVTQAQRELRAGTGG